MTICWLSKGSSCCCWVNRRRVHQILPVLLPLLPIEVSKHFVVLHFSFCFSSLISSPSSTGLCRSFAFPGLVLCLSSCFYPLCRCLQCLFRLLHHLMVGWHESNAFIEKRGLKKTVMLLTRKSSCFCDFQWPEKTCLEYLFPWLPFQIVFSWWKTIC